MTRNIGSENSRPYARIELRGEAGWRLAAGSVSGSARQATSQRATAASASATKMPRQEVTFSNALPKEGARMGATPRTRIEPRQQLGSPDAGEQVAHHSHNHHRDRGAGQTLERTGDS